MKAIEQNIEKEIAQAVMEEQPMQPPAPKRKKMLTESTAAKVIAFLLMLVMTAVTAGGVLGAVFLYSTDVYVTSETAFKQELFSNIAWGDGQMLLNFLIWNSEEQVYQMNTEAADSYCAERNISYVMVQDKTGRELWYTGLAEYDSPWQFRFSYDWANPERPRAPIFPVSIPSIRASISASSPREQLTITTPSRILATDSRLMMWRLESSRGMWRVMTSDWASRVSKST